MTDSHSDPYEAAGVDYVVLDSAKRLAQSQARMTSANPAGLGAAFDDASRGEPASVVRFAGQSFGFVLECLGTKSMNIAHECATQASVERFDAIGYDTVAAAVNDCCCVGALPFIVNAYFATGSASFYDGTRASSLVSGFARACNDSGAAWGGGESPTLSGIVDADQIDLGASALGVIPNGVAPLYGDTITPGDTIVFVESSGLHTNGASLARSVARQLEGGWSTPLPSGRPFGHAILDETIIYVPLVAAIFERGLGLHYASHITGHGLRKLMRADQDFTYRVIALPTPPAVLTFLAEQGKLSPREAYGTLNMGVGFALMVAEQDAATIVELAEELGYEALVAGRVEKGARRVVLEPIDVTFEGFELELR